MAVKRFPNWIRQPWPSGAAFREVKDLMGDLDLHTVCQSAHCPNQAECWGRRTATFMVMGNTCTRHCTYCAVNSGKPGPLDVDEPAKIAEAVYRLGLKHTVITSVTRDDLPDGGADHIAQTIEAIHTQNTECTVEALVQDFCGVEKDIRRVIDAQPEIFSHNIELTESRFHTMRDQRFTYQGSLDVLRMARDMGGPTLIKSAFMLGCGETQEDVHKTLEDLLAHGADAVAMGQYLQPTTRHGEVHTFITPEQFKGYEEKAYELGFAFAVAGPFVRSSYRSEALLEAPVAQERLNKLVEHSHGS